MTGAFVANRWRVVATACILAACSSTPSATPRLDPEQAINAFCQSYPGLSLSAATTARGEDRFYGCGAPLPSNRTIYEIASVTKTFTATLLAQAAAEGRLDLDDPIGPLAAKHIEVPEVVYSLKLSDLATHHSGLPVQVPAIGYAAALEGALDNPYSILTAERIGHMISELRLQSPPGKEFHYSNLGFGLLGYAMQSAFGAASYEQLVNDRITAPLGMENTFVSVPASKEAMHAIGHDQSGAETSRWTSPSHQGDGALRSTSYDLLLYAKAALRKDAVMKTEVAMVVRADAIAGHKVGLGWMYSTEQHVWWHNGGSGGFRAFVGLSLEKQTAVVLLLNGTASVDALGFEILSLLDQAEQD